MRTCKYCFEPADPSRGPHSEICAECAAERAYYHGQQKGFKPARFAVVSAPPMSFSPGAEFGATDLRCSGEEFAAIWGGVVFHDRQMGDTIPARVARHRVSGHVKGGLK